ncbi:MAG: LamG-like jellyroll fold domain-containing protein [Planctomycetota bacterium]
MRRKSILVSPTAILVFLTLCGSTLAFEVLEPGYSIEIFAAYSSAGIDRGPHKMVFADNGNLYASHLDDGSIWCITPDGGATKLVGGLNGAQGIDWGGGTNYGNYLYVAANGSIVRVGLDGTTSNFANRYCAGSLGIDRTGNYGGYMYTTTGCQDHTYRIDFVGNVTMFSDFPGWRDGGGPADVAFDTTGNYGNLMYMGTAFSNVAGNEYMSGLFSLDSSGNATRLIPGVVHLIRIDFDVTGNFASKMYVIGKEPASVEYLSIWKVESDGSYTDFAQTTATRISDLAFSPDGAMYVAEYDEGIGFVVIRKISSGERSLVGLEISGPNEVASNFSTSYKAVAHYDDDSTRDVTKFAGWSVEPEAIAGIEDGVLTTKDIIKDELATIRATYTEVYVTFEAEKMVDIFAICPTGTALRFDGVDDYVDCGNSDSLYLEDEGFTVGAWVKLNSSLNNRWLVAKGAWGNDRNGDYWLNLHPNTRNFNFAILTSAGAYRSPQFSGSTGQWYNITGVFDGSSLALYVNGQSVGTPTPVTGSIATNDHIVQIGGEPTKHANIHGVVDEVRIYSRALTGEEIRANIHRRLSGDEPGLVGYWDFDEGQGQIVYDLSGNDNHGQLGSTPDVDGSDPAWIESDAPIGLCNPYLIATAAAKKALKHKRASLKELQAALAQEWTMYEALEQWLESGDFVDLSKGDIVKARQKTHSAMQHEEQSIDMLGKGFGNLLYSLSSLGYGPQPPGSNWPPNVTISKPQNGAEFNPDQTIEIEADAWDYDGSVVTVEFFANGTKIAEDTNGADGWTINWSDHPEGTYNLTATATDDEAAATTSEAIVITMAEEPPPPPPPPGPPGPPRPPIPPGPPFPPRP